MADINFSSGPAVKLFSKDNCSFCRRAKALLEHIGAPYQEVNLEGDLDGLKALATLTGLMTLPQIVVGTRLVGGFDALDRSVQTGEFNELLAAA